MKNKKLIKEDIESIKFMMNYDTRKTLTENREILNEIDFNETNQKIASALWLASTGSGTNPEQIVNSLSQIKTAEQFFDVQNKFVAQSTRNGSTYKGIADMINYEFQSNLKSADLTNRILKYLPTINYLINKIPGLTSSITPGKKEIGSTPIGTINIQYDKAEHEAAKAAKVTTDPTKKTTDPKVVGAGSEPTTKKATTPLPIPTQLKDSAGVKKFQEWVVGVKGDKTILGGYGADGKFGGRTSKAWNTYGNEYLNPKLETLKPLEVKPITPAAGTAQTTDGYTTPEPELQLPNNQLQQAPQTNQNMTGRQKRQFNRFVKKQERMKKRNQNQSQTQTNAIDSAVPQTNTNKPGSTNA
jgi:hypothetical protein